MKLLQFLMQGRGGQSAAVLQRYQENAEYFMCACLQKGNRNVQKTPGGLLFWQQWNNIQFVTSASFLLTVYSDYLTAARKNIQCPGGTVQKHSMWQQSLALRDRWHQFSWSGKSKGCSEKRLSEAVAVVHEFAMEVIRRRRSEINKARRGFEVGSVGPAF